MITLAIALCAFLGAGYVWLRGWWYVALILTVPFAIAITCYGVPIGPALLLGGLLAWAPYFVRVAIRGSQTAGSFDRGAVR